MNLWESTEVSIDALKANKLRSFLTMLGVVIGVIAVVLLVSIALGVRSQITGTIEGLGSNLYMVFPGSVGRGVGGSRMTVNRLKIDHAYELMQKMENMYYLYVVDEHGRLAGIVSLKDLVLESPTRKIREIMNPEVISAYVYSDQEEVARLVKKYDLVAIPVVDQNQRLVGRVTHDDIMDVVEEETDEDIGHMAGVIPHEVGEESPLRVSKARLPWLIVGLCGELVAAAVIYHFESSLIKAIAIACFFPVIMAMGGNTGTQAATVVVRGLATGDIRLVSIGKRLWLELRAALINGFVVASMLGVIVGFWLSDYRLGFVVALAMMCVVLNAGFVGSAVPLVMNRLNIDPALATGPFISTSNDIFGLLIYLGLVTAYFRLFSV